MSALPIQQLPVQEQEAEVIYLVVPNTATMPQPVVRPFSMAEQMSAFMYSFQMSTHKSREKGLALAAATFAAFVVGLWAYYFKSAIGIDLFPHQHIENFGPFPGWQR